MVKKKVEKPIYPTAPLVVSRERFCSLLSDQISRGNDLLNRKTIKKSLLFLKEVAVRTGAG